MHGEGATYGGRALSPWSCVTEPRSKWPFPPTDGGPRSRPRIVKLENVLIAIVADPAEAERELRAAGFTDESLRAYTSEQVLAYDEEFRSRRGLVDRAIGSVVDDGGAMADYVEYARQGRSALWVRVAGREDANRVIRHLADHGLVHVWFHGRDGVEVLRIT